MLLIKKFMIDMLNIVKMQLAIKETTIRQLVFRCDSKFSTNCTSL